MPDTTVLARAAATRPLRATWHPGRAIVNLRGDPDDPAVLAAVTAALGLPLPVQPCTTVADDTARIAWAGPDDWFVIGPPGQASALAARLRTALAGLHHAVTDVSCGYTVLALEGPAARDTLARGCPLDLHPRAFRPGDCAGSHFFKASVWLWQVDDSPRFEMLVRRSFVDYVDLLMK